MGDADRSAEDVIAALEFFAQVTDELVDPEGRSMHDAMRTAARLLREAHAASDAAAVRRVKQMARIMAERDEAVDAAARLRELCAFLIDACATHRIPVPINSSLLDLAADIASDGGAAAVGSVEPEGETE
jgi:translation initiation factor 2B subunit (eIF-2B alpha/beta/delta family)